MPDLNKNQVPRLARWMLNRMIIYKMNHSVIDDFDETYREVLEVKGVFRARIWYWRDVLKSMPEYIQFITSWRILMLSNYLKIAYRHFISHKLFSFINVFGLALGLSICTIISLWVQREMSYDSFHDKADRIYRVERELFRDHAYSRWPITNALYKQALVDDYPEITHAVRLWRREMALTDYKDLSHNQELYMTDNSIFDVFSFGLEEGDPKTALVEPNSMVLTRELAIRYFGTEDVVGQTRTFEQGENSVDFKVTGILAPVPENSHIHFDMLVSYSTIPVNPNMSWRGNNLYTYILTREGVSGQELEARMFEFIEKHLEVAYQGLISQGLGIHDVLKMHLFPITNIHLNPAENWEMEIGGSQTSVYIFSIVAILILLIACINFINLSTARAKKRAREVSLRKTVGADRNQLKWQFIQESMLLAFTALLIAFMMATMLIPVFQRLFDEHLTLALLFNVKTICLLFGATALVGILAGLYPAFYLTRFEPAFILRGMGTVGKGQSAFRRNMVIIQFGISIVLIIGMLTVHRQ
ncbi:ABC transporter permease, partial [bacterium]|nr:ABC transporter permease [bacterium]